MNRNYHIPVLLHQAIEGLNINPKGTYVDATFGGGGHSSLILNKLSTGKLIAFDADSQAMKNDLNADNFLLIHANFRFIKNFLLYQNIKKVDGILADLGISTHHIDCPQRGFSFRFDADLDMRMNPQQNFSAKDVVNDYSKKKLTHIFKNYADLKNAHNIAKTIVQRRNRNKINSTFDLSDAIIKFVPRKAKNKFLAKIFQAIRIEVNDEINNLKYFLTDSIELLNKNSRFVIISYHSIEDKVIKNFFKTGNFNGELKTDMYGNKIRPLKPINKKVIKPGDDEIEKNNRARSAKLRIAEKL